MKMKNALISAVLCLVLTACPLFAAEKGGGKELQKDWENIVAAYNSVTQTPDISAAELAGNFAERWRDVSRFEAARAKYLQGLIYYKNKDYSKAITVFKALVDAYGNMPYADSAMYKIGECLYNMGKFNEAIEAYNAYRFKYNTSMFHMEAVYGIALSYLNLKEYKKADRELTDFLAKNKFYEEDPDIKLAGGIIDFYLERYDAAEKKLRKITSDVSYYYRGHSLARMKNYPDAASAFKNIVDMYKDSRYLESALYNKAECFYKGENYSVAGTDYRQFALRFPMSKLTPYANLKLGSSLFREGKYKDAINAYRSVITGYGDDRVKAYAQYLIGECFRKSGDIKGAQAAYEAVLSNYPNVFDAVASAQMRAGWCYLYNKDYDKTIEVLEAYAKKFVTHEDLNIGFYLLGNAYYYKKNYAKALEMYRYILEKFKYTNITEAALLMTAICYYEQKQYSLLASEVSIAIRAISDKFRDPEGKNIRARTYYYLGEAYYKNGLYAPAANAYRQIIDNYYESDIVNEARAGLAWTYYQLENYKPARTMARDVLSSNVDQKTKLACEILIAHSLFAEKEYEKAANAYQNFAYNYKANKDQYSYELVAEALYQQGKAYEVIEAYGNAIESWKTVTVNYPKSSRAAEATFKMSDIYFKAQKYDEAIAGFKLTMTKWPESEFAEDAMLSIAEVYYNSGKEADAVKAYQDFLKKYPDSTKIKSVEDGMQRAMYVKAEKKEDPDMMMDFYSKYPGSNLAINALYSAAEMYYKATKFQKAIEVFQKLIAEFPNDSLAINANYYIAACYQELKRADDAINAYKAFIKNYPKHELAPEVTFNLATTAFTNKNYAEAVLYYGKILERYPDSQYAANSLYNSALAYTELGKKDEAIAIYKDFIKKYPEDEKTKGLELYIAGIYLEQKRYPEALAAFEQVFAKGTEEEKIQAIYSIGQIYGNTENLEKQIETYERMVDVKPPDNIYRLNALVDLAGKYEEKQDWKNAVRIYELISASKGAKEYVTFAQGRIPQIKAAYPDAFK